MVTVQEKNKIQHNKLLSTKLISVISGLVKFVQTSLILTCIVVAEIITSSKIVLAGVYSLTGLIKYVQVYNKEIKCNNLLSLFDLNCRITVFQLREICIQWAKKKVNKNYLLEGPLLVSKLVCFFCFWVHIRINLFTQIQESVQ